MDEYEIIAPFYDSEHSDFVADICFYRNLIGQGPVLEIGSGTGRILEPLAACGLEVWGVEKSIAMLEHARARIGSIENVHLLHAEAEALNLEQRFEAIIFSLNTLWHFRSARAQEDILRVAGRHLSETGVLVIDSSNPISLLDKDSQGEVRERFVKDLPGDRVRGYSTTWDDSTKQELKMALVYERESQAGTTARAETTLRLRYLQRDQMEAALSRSGLRPRHFYGNYDLDPYSRDSPQLIALATRA